MATEILKLDESFDARDLAKKAVQTALLFDGGEQVDEDEQEILRTLNEGLASFLSGEYKAEEPEETEGYEAVQAWVDFASEISDSYKNLADAGYVAFHEEDTIGDVLAAQAQELGMVKTLPAYIQDAIDWGRVEEYLRSAGGIYEIKIDGELYVTGIYLAF